VNSPTGRPVGAYVFMCCKRALSSPTSRTSQVAPTPQRQARDYLSVASFASFLSDASSEHVGAYGSSSGTVHTGVQFICCKRALSSPTSRTSQVAAPAAASSWRLAVRRQFHASLASFLSGASSGHTSSAAAAAEVARRAITDCSRTT